MNKTPRSAKQISAALNNLKKIKNSGKPLTAERCNKIAFALSGKPAVGEIAVGESNIHAKKWKVRSPLNVVYEFVNAREFIRTHAHLFLPEDVIWRKAKPNKPTSTTTTCRAEGGFWSLTKLTGRRNGSWKGWTLVSELEEKVNHGRDVLLRENAKVLL